MSIAPLIEARGLGKSFASMPVLRGVTMSTVAGAGAMVIGRNGAGKSTLLKLLAGLTAPTAGEALVFGRPSRGLDARYRRRIGLLTHQGFLYPNLTARENLEFYAGLYGLTDRAAAITAWLERVGLSHAADERVRTFSRGMDQRLSIARAMLPRPEAILMDEPFASLDPDGVAIVAGVIRDAIAGGAAVVITAHEPIAAVGPAFELFEIVRGRLMPSPGATPRADAVASLP